MLRDVPARLLVFALLAGVACARTEGPQRWLVQFAERSFDLRAFRAANAQGDAERVAAIVQELEQKVRRDQDGFVKQVRERGGRVVEQFWIVNACAIEIAGAEIPKLRALPNVQRIEADAQYVPLLEKATNVVNHNSDRLNTRQQRGAGVAVAILDTGQDASMGTSGRPHRLYFPDGDLDKQSRLLLNRQIGTWTAEDTRGHGTAVAAVAAGGDWGRRGSDHGHAPHAGIVGYSVANDFLGSTSTATLTKAWQQVAADAAKYKIVAANLSYSGSPDPLATDQQALDSCARNADVLITVAAGNFPYGTTQSNSCANGLAVGAVNSDSHVVWSNSSTGPLPGDPSRFYPDLAACGVDLTLPLHDDELLSTVASGTSLAAPQVCGAAALLRAAVPSLSALETKVVLLASARDISAQNPAPPRHDRNAFGMGLLRDDYAMTVAESQQYGSDSVSRTSNTWESSLICEKGQQYRFAISWMRATLSSRNWSDLNLEVRNGATVVASSRTNRNLYELVVWTAANTGEYTIHVDAPWLESTTQPFAWAFARVAPPVTAGGFAKFGGGCRGTGLGGEVLPLGSDLQMGVTNNSVPFASGDSRCQQVFPAEDFAGSRALTGISLRQDNSIPVRGSGPQQVKIQLGYSSYGPTTLTNTFTNNPLPNTMVTVFDGTIQLPMLPGLNSDPRVFAFRIQFTKPFVFQQQKGRNLLIDVINTSSAKVDLGFDTERQRGTRAARVFATASTRTTGIVQHNYGLVIRFDQFGPGFGPIPDFTVRGMPEIHSDLRCELDFAKTSAPALLMLGFSNRLWGAIPLPLDLGGLGAPGCSLLVANDVATPTITSSTGTASLRVPLPNEKAWIGLSLFGQFGVFDGTTNSLGFVFSNGGAIRLGGQN